MYIYSEGEASLYIARSAKHDPSASLLLHKDATQQYAEYDADANRNTYCIVREAITTFSLKNVKKRCAGCELVIAWLEMMKSGHELVISKFASTL